MDTYIHFLYLAEFVLELHVSDKSVENIYTHIIFFSECHPVYEVMCKNIEEPKMPQMEM
jgi:hypothetical protein